MEYALLHQERSGKYSSQSIRDYFSESLSKPDFGNSRNSVFYQNKGQIYYAIHAAAQFSLYTISFTIKNNEHTVPKNNGKEIFDTFKKMDLIGQPQYFDAEVKKGNQLIRKALSNPPE